MRLLHRSETGEITLTRDLVNNDQMPSYAILSHTWGNDTEEVTFQDMTNRTGEHKTGFNKIRYCGEQAAQDGLQYFWVDTCCIDKSSSSELSEAINSMYKWYQRSKVCYVYLDDVTAQENAPWILPADGHLEEDERVRLEDSEFAKSRWFTRGWTLQELLAPNKITFYGKNWLRLGDHKGLLAAIVHITKIDQQALKNSSFDLSRICTARKMSWAAKRQTTRPEDQAYCLMGIFNVHIPLLYGKGSYAFVRLQEEILKNTDDDSLLAWNARGLVDLESGHRHDKLLAPGTAFFEGCGKLIRTSFDSREEPWLMSNIGLTITMPVIHIRDRNDEIGTTFYALLDCRDEEEPDQVLALFGHTSRFRSDGIKVLYPPHISERLQTLSRQEIESMKFDQNSQSILLYRRQYADIEDRLYAEPVVIYLEISLSHRNSTRDIIEVKNYYPSHAWTVRDKKLVVTEWGSAENLAAVWLTYRGDQLLLILQSISQYALIHTYGMKRPTLVRCPRGISNMRSLIPQIPTLLKSEQHAYEGPLAFQYLHNERDVVPRDLMVKAYIKRRKMLRTTGNKNNENTGESAGFDAEIVAQFGVGYKPLEHDYGSE